MPSARRRAIDGILELHVLQGIVPFPGAMTVPRTGGDFGAISRENVEIFNSCSQVWEPEKPQFPAKKREAASQRPPGMDRPWYQATGLVHRPLGREDVHFPVDVQGRIDDVVVRIDHS